MAAHVPITPEAAIPALLIASLEAWVASRSPALPVAWAGIGFDPTEGQTYLAVQHMPNITESWTVSGDDKRLRGLHQITVVYPKDGSGIVPAYDLAGEVVEHFKKGTNLVGHGFKVQISSAPWPAPHLTEGDWIRIPVTVPFLCVTRDA
jgi:hypothetical protein